MIAEVRKEPDQQRNIGNGWHTDHSYDQAPALGSMLYAREVPKTGGDTLFASMYAAYDALSDGLKTTLEGLRACHSSRHVFGPEGRRAAATWPAASAIRKLATQDAVHPVVIRHPETGRKALYVNPGFTSASRAGPRRSRARCSTTCTSTRPGPNSPAAFTGATGRWPCGTTVPPGTSPSTTITASAGCCTASQFRACRCIELPRPEHGRNGSGTPSRAPVVASQRSGLDFRLRWP